MPVGLRKKVALISLTAMLASCDNRELDSSNPTPVCEIVQFGWSSEAIDPPIRSKTHLVTVNQDSLLFDARESSLEDIKREVVKRNSLSPSVYLFLKRGGAVSCEKYKSVARGISNAFNCERNYCYALN